MANAYGCYDANMETKVEKFFVFFITNLGLLQSGTGIFQAERHADVAKHTTRGEKCCLLLVLLRNLDLVVA